MSSTSRFTPRRARRPQPDLRRFPSSVALAAAAGICLVAAVPAAASRMQMKDGRILEGQLAQIGSINDKPNPGIVAKTTILIDDGLRRTFVPFRHVQSVNELDAKEPVEKFEVPQQISQGGNRVAGVGRIVRATPFDEFGRRILEMVTSRGIEAVVQGITEITPEWTKLECVQIQGMQYIWDMRIATSSIPRQQLDAILHQAIESQALSPDLQLDQRLKIVRLYLQAERFKDAEAELAAVVAAFPNLDANQKRLFQQTQIRLKQANARRTLEEIEVRRKSGQHRLARSLLEKFPTENVAGETLQAVRQVLEEYAALDKRGHEAIARIDALLLEIKDTALRKRLEPIRAEIAAELNYNNLDRLAAFMQFHAASELSPEERIALAVSGWLAGTDSAMRNLPTAVSMYDVRNLIRSYLAEPLQRERDNTLELLRKQEGFIPELASQMIAVMKPPKPLTGADEQIPGLYRLSVDDVPGVTPIDYLVQLPREYDPHRRYPVIITMHSAGTTPELQVDWWAGPPGPGGERFGHADRNGYIVLAPRWAKEAQDSAEYEEHEHAAVVLTLRDAFRRLSIDSDRVFLSGHSMGADTAWDIGLAHPDLFAGLICITPTVGPTTNYLKDNAAYVPTYFICGEMDGKRWVDNVVQLDYVQSRGFDTTLVQFRGRGHEHFSDEIMRLFDWMGRRKRDFFPTKFECRSTRENDYFFYWITIDQMPERAMFTSANPNPKGDCYVNAEISLRGKDGKNRLYVKTEARSVSIWLSPEAIDLKQPTEIFVRGKPLRRASPYLEPDMKVMLDDALMRGDRQHVFWTKIVVDD
jgi:predicted esterase